jgi:hypothetical protein
MRRNIERALDILETTRSDDDSLIAKDAIRAGNSCWRERIRCRERVPAKCRERLSFADEDVRMEFDDVRKALTWKRIRGGIDSLCSFRMEQFADDDTLKSVVREKQIAVVMAIDEFEAQFNGGVPSSLRRIRSDYKRAAGMKE